MTLDRAIGYNFTDIFVPLKAAIRHLPEITKIKDNQIRYIETAANALITLAQLATYGSLIDMYLHFK